MRRPSHPLNRSSQLNFNYIGNRFSVVVYYYQFVIVDCIRTTHEHLLLINVMDLVYASGSCDALITQLTYFMGFYWNTSNNKREKNIRTCFRETERERERRTSRCSGKFVLVRSKERRRKKMLIELSLVSGLT